MTAHKERLAPSLPADPETWWEESAHLWRYYYAAERLTQYASVDYAMDLACGTGYGTMILALAGLQAGGYDYHAGSVMLARHNYPRVWFSVADLDGEETMLDLISDERIVGAVCLEALEHLKDPWLFLKRLPSTVRHLICSAPIVPNSAPYNPFHRHDFTLESFRALVTGAGFEIQDERLQSSPWRINLYAVIHGERRDG